MTISDTRKAPFPWPGGKRLAAPKVWEALGDVTHYVEPFFGTGAVLLNRPHLPNRTYYSETIGDADGYVCNFWRAVTHDPDGVAEHASWPVIEADKHARTIWLLQNPPDIDRLSGDPGYYDTRTAGWWVWSVCVQIGDWPGPGPWWPDENGRLKKWAPGEPRPDGISRQLPYLGCDGRGVNRPQTREPGISRKLPQLVSGGRGVIQPQTREPGITRKLPHLANNGRGVNHPGTRAPALTDETEYHPRTMPELRRWLAALSARLRHVRVVHGDWRRTVGTGAALTLTVRAGESPCGVFLDPPYAGTESTYHAAEGEGIAVAAAEWATTTATDPRWRIVAAGYTGDAAHTIYLNAGWRETEWYEIGHLTGGYKSTGGGHDRSRQERLYLSPHCLTQNKGATLW